MKNKLIIKEKLNEITEILQETDFKNIFYEKISEDEKISNVDFPLSIYNLQGFMNQSILSTIKDNINYKIILTFAIKIYTLDVLEAFMIAEEINNKLINKNYSCSIDAINEKTGFNTTCLLITVRQLVFK